MAFSLAEILISLAIIALLAAVVVPTVFSRLESARGDAIIGEMQALQNGVLLFYRDVGRYPARLDFLNTLASGDFDSCGVAIPAPNFAKYRGPYINRSIVMINPPTNTKYILATGDSVESAISRVNITTATGTQRVLQILVSGPDQTVADDIDAKIDGAVNAGAGIIHYATVGKIVKWSIPIRSAAC